MSKRKIRPRCLKRLAKGAPYCTRRRGHRGWCEAPYLWGWRPAIFRWTRR